MVGQLEDGRQIVGDLYTKLGGWKTRVGGWKIKVGGWKIKTGGWRTSWRMEDKTQIHLLVFVHSFYEVSTIFIKVVPLQKACMLSLLLETNKSSEVIKSKRLLINPSR